MENKLYKPILLVVIYVSAHKMRNIQKNIIFCYKKYLKDYDVYYVNMFMSPGLKHCLKREWDLIIFHSSLLSLRFNRSRFISLIDNNKQSIMNLKAAVRAITVQDEFVHMDLVCDFIKRFDISHVFSVAPETEIKNLYFGIDFLNVKFHRVLTGYIDSDTVSLVEDMANTKLIRPFFIGYRVVSTPQWGSFNLLKKEIADVFIMECEKRGLVHDIKIGEQYFLNGDDWVKHLAKCKATIGIEGGSNILDLDGAFSEKIKKLIDDGIKVNKQMLLEFEKNIPNIQLKALSPRHLEACMTKTCQVLVEGEYNGVLQPWVHYLPLKQDFSNIREIFEFLEDNDRVKICLLYTSPSPRDRTRSRMPSSA